GGLSAPQTVSPAPYSAAEGARLRSAVMALGDDAESRVRFQLALTLGEFDESARLSALSKLARRDFADRWHARAILSSVGSSAWPLLRSLVQEEPSWLNSPVSGQAGFLEQTAALIGSSHSQT